MQLERLSCRSDICQNLTCPIKFLAHGKREMFLACFLPYEVMASQNHITLYTRNGRSWQVFLIDAWEDACKVLKNFKPKKSVLQLRSAMEFLANFFYPHSNFIHPCPHSGLVYIRNFTFPVTEGYLHPLPVNRYRVEYTLYDVKNKTITWIEAQFSLTIRGVRSYPKDA